MKKRISFLITVLMFCCLCSTAFAESAVTGSAILPIATPGGIVTPGSGTPVELQGNVTPAILSVTMPSNILFDIGLGVEGDNKVISPQISFTNNSNAPVSVYVTDLQTDLSGLGASTEAGIQYIPSVHGGSVYVATAPALENPGWSGPYTIYLEGSPQYPFATPSAIILSGGAITAGAIVSTESNEITLGLKAASIAPTQLWDTKWLVEGVDVPMKVADIPAIGSSQFYVVGTLGAAVPENRSFIVRPTFIAQYQL